MAIDIVALVIFVFALYKGWTQGLVMALFTFVSYLLALVIAFKFSGWVAAHYLKDLDQGGRWPTILAFLMVMVAVMIIVRIAGKILEKALELMLMGIFNKLAGIVLFCTIHFTLYAVVLVYLKNFGWVSHDLIRSSQVATSLLTWGVWVVDMYAGWVPELKNLFNQTINFIKH
jgi:membrane protein required for colicin V production